MHHLKENFHQILRGVGLQPNKKKPFSWLKCQLNYRIQLPDCSLHQHRFKFKKLYLNVKNLSTTTSR